MTDFDNDSDVIDSRDVIERIAELEADDRDEDEDKELASLLSLASEAEGVGDWTYGAMLIRDSYFEDYARELAEDIGDIPRDGGGWPFSHIDWGRAAEALQQDYTPVEFDGVTYWVRS